MNCKQIIQTNQTIFVLFASSHRGSIAVVNTRHFAQTVRRCVYTFGRNFGWNTKKPEIRELQEYQSRTRVENTRFAFYLTVPVMF